MAEDGKHVRGEVAVLKAGVEEGMFTWRCKASNVFFFFLIVVNIAIFKRLKLFLRLLNHQPLLDIIPRAQKGYRLY